MKALLPQLIDALAPLLVAIITIVFGRLALIIQAKAKSERLRTIGLALTEQARDVVLEMEQNVVSKMRKQSEDGKIDPSEVSDLKRTALDSLKKYMGAHGRDATLKAFGFANEEEMDAMLASKLESEVAKARAMALVNARTP